MQPPQPIQTPQPPQQHKRLNLLQVIAIVAVVGFMVWYLVTAFTPEKEKYGTITLGSMGNTYTGDCVVVRDESPYNAEGVNNIVYQAEEGSTVYRGTSICEVYSTGYSSKEMSTLQTYRDQIKEYQLKLLNSEVASDTQMDKLENEVLNCAREIRSLISGVRGNMENQEKLLATAISARQNYLKQKYADDQRLSRLYDDELSQQQRINSWTKQYAAMMEGIVSFYSDGYEYGLTGDNYQQYTPAEVRSMYNGNKPQSSTSLAGKTTIYRMVQNGSWYVLLLMGDSNWKPTDGESYELRLDTFKNTKVTAKVASSTKSGGELLVRMVIQGDVKSVLYIRTCTAEISDSSVTLTVPKRAIYRQDGKDGIVVVTEEAQVFIPVNVLETVGDVAYISEVQSGVLYEGQTVLLF